MICTVQLILAVHNLVRYTGSIKKASNKALLHAFYFLVIVEALSIVGHDILNFIRSGELIYEICDDK